MAPHITLSTLLSVSPQYTVFHSCVTFPFWTQISLLAPYYQSLHKNSSSPLCYLLHLAQISLSVPYHECPHNMQIFTPVLPSSFDPDIILSTLLSVYPQYTVLHPCVTFPFWPQKSLSASYYQSPHNIQFFTLVLPSPFGPRYNSHHPIISLPTIYISSPLCYLPILDPDITLSTLL